MYFLRLIGVLWTGVLAIPSHSKLDVFGLLFTVVRIPSCSIRFKDAIEAKIYLPQGTRKADS